MSDRSIHRPAHALALALLLAFAGASLAQIGADPATLVERASLEGAPLDDGLFRTDSGLVVEPVVRNGALYAVRGQSDDFGDAGILELARIVGAATGFGAGIEQPVVDFMAESLARLAGIGPSVVGVERFRLTLEVEGGEGDAPYGLTFALALAEVREEAFPEARHVKGPADAPIVIRDFSDLSCPACRRFVLDVMPVLESTLLARGDVRIEFHHFPLIGSFPNSFRAAEMTECVADANPADPVAFWTYHDELYARQGDWSRLSAPEPLLLQIAQDVGLSTEGVGDCIAEGRHVDTVQAGYDAASALQLRGTPSIFVGGFQVENWVDLGAYREAIGYIETFGSDADSVVSD
jgi:protein-disulfide isomerase